MQKLLKAGAEKIHQAFSAIVLCIKGCMHILDDTVTWNWVLVVPVVRDR